MTNSTQFDLLVLMGLLLLIVCQVTVPEPAVASSSAPVGTIVKPKEERVKKITGNLLWNAQFPRVGFQGSVSEGRFPMVGFLYHEIENATCPSVYNLNGQSRRPLMLSMW